MNKHGMSKTKFIGIYRAIIYRTTNKNCSRYKDYGGRGIKVCDRWKDVNNFIADMLPGYTEGLSIERIDNDSDYSKENCKWITRAQQAFNKRDSFKITHRGVTKTLSEWAIDLKVDHRMLWQRIKRDGWTTERALTTPVRLLRNQKNFMNV